MAATPVPARLFHFGPFELDSRSGELRKHGVRVKLREQPIRILLMLLENPGEVVLRDEIRLRLWPNNTIVEFDHGINAAIQKLRDALGESAGSPRFVETVARRGYRFIGEVERVAASVQEPAAAPPSEPEPEPDRNVGSHYRLLGKLGEGGMGIVYRAEDLKLGRTVAVKFLPTDVAELPESILRRFEREARAASALNHPHICTIYGLEDFDGQPAIVMELVEGETLAARLSRGPLPLEEALRLARQIAGALVEAQKKGVTHRDLKPSNIMLTKSGVKVLDFGLAKIERSATGSAPGDDAETVTEKGALVGTLSYMSPEQLEGKDVDARSDIFSFGLVLSEMITGERAFEGERRASVIAAILDREPKTIQPEWLNRIVRACLAKDPAERFQTARDLLRALEWGGPTEAVEQRRSPRPWIYWSLTAAFAAIAIVAIIAWVRAGLVSSRTTTLTIVPHAGSTLVPVGALGSIPQISPDGSSILFHTQGGVWVQRLDSIEPKLVPGSKEVMGLGFWSADSRSVVFPGLQWFLTVLLPEGPPEEFFRLPGPSRGGTWSDTGAVMFAAFPYTTADKGASIERSGLFTVAASGHEPEPVELPQPRGATRPQFLPGTGLFFLFLRLAADGEQNEVTLARLQGGKAVDLVTLMKNETAASYTPAGGGRLLFVHNDNLYSRKLDLGKRKLVGDAELVQERVASGPVFNLADFSVSRSGAIAWRPGIAALSQVTIFDRSGREIGTAGPPLDVHSLALSPDESRLTTWNVATSSIVTPGQSGNLRVSPGVPATWRWSPDGSRQLGQNNRRGLWARSLNGDGEPHKLGEIPGNLQDISPDGKQILYCCVPMTGGIWATRLEGTPEELKPRAVVPPGEASFAPAFSPDGRWIVYSVWGAEGPFSGAIYVQPSQGGGTRTQIFGARGNAVWRKDGKEIIIADPQAVWSVSVEPGGGGLRFGVPMRLFSGLRMPSGTIMVSRLVDVSRDGSRIYYPQAIKQPEPDVIRVRTGWAR